MSEIADEGQEIWQFLEEEKTKNAELHEEVDRLERILQAPLSLKDLEVAWDAAEVPTAESPIREGDVVIVRHGGGFTVEPADRILSGQTHGRERILSRAPKREPWADLADVLRAWDAEPADADADGMAKWFHERGVRVTGGEA